MSPELARLLIVVALALAAGVAAGSRLARRGVTADNALVGRQRGAYAVFLAVAAVAALIYWGQSASWVPAPVFLYAEAGVWDGARALAGFALGLLLALEWRGRHEYRRRKHLIGGSAVLALALGFLLYRSLPVTGILLASYVEDGVVMQTTGYTCAPASIATLARLTGADTGMTERAAVALTGTTREGTSTHAEMRALRALGFHPVYRRGLTPESLAVLGPAVLHVDEPVLATTIRHAVALLAVDTAAHTITVGNPLHGRQVKRFDEMKDYWLGEAVVLGPR
jgi:hypothetical protein